MGIYSQVCEMLKEVRSIFPWEQKKKGRILWLENYEVDWYMVAENYLVVRCCLKMSLKQVELYLQNRNSLRHYFPNIVVHIQLNFVQEISFSCCVSKILYSLYHWLIEKFRLGSSFLLCSFYGSSSSLLLFIRLTMTLFPLSILLWPCHSVS